jgi:protein gp37
VSDRSAIEWTNASWNPVTGCSKVSPGCAHCYAEAFAERWRGIPGHSYEQGFDLRLWPQRLELPLRWRKPRLIFVNSMSDLFHPDVPPGFIEGVWETMARAHWHTFQVLTKRPERMPDLIGDLGLQDPPLPNVWVGTSIENRRFVHRADDLRRTPAVVRFISAEPLLGPLRCNGHRRWTDGYTGPSLCLDGIDWLICGGESGAKHRPIRPEWVRDLRDACNRSRTAFFLKQWGGRTPKAGGRLLDGRTWDEMPRSASQRSMAVRSAREHSLLPGGAVRRWP